MVSYLFVSLIGFPYKGTDRCHLWPNFYRGVRPGFSGAACAANKVTIHLYQKLRNVSKLEILTKWAAADVPVRIPGAVVAVPIERASIRTVVHVTTREHHQPHVSLFPVFFVASCVAYYHGFR